MTRGGLRALSHVVVAMLLVGCGGGQQSDLAGARAEYLSAYRHYQAGDYQAAINAFERFVSRRSRSGDMAAAHYFLGRSHHRLTHHDQARRHYDMVAVRYPGSVYADNAVLQTGVSYLDQGDAPTGRQWLRQVLNVYPASNSADNAQYHLGRSYGMEGNHDAAIQAYSILIASDPLSTLADNAHYRIGRAFYDQGLYAEAMAWFSGLVGAVPTALYADYSAADTAQYYLARSYHKLARINGGFVPARQQYRQFIIDFPGHALQDNARYWSARTWFDAGDFPSALAAFRSMLSETYVDISAFDNAAYYVGRCLHEMASAPLVYDPALYPEASYAAARAAYAQLDANYQTSLLRDNARFRIGQSLYDEGNYTQALLELQGLIESRAGAGPLPDYSALDEAWFYVGRSHHRLAEYASAAEAYGHVMTLSADTSLYADNAHYQHARLEYDQGNWLLARAGFEALLMPVVPLPYPDDSAHDQAWYYLGLSCEQLALIDPLQAGTLNASAMEAYATLLQGWPQSVYASPARVRYDMLAGL